MKTDDLAQRSDVYILSAIETAVKGDECAERMLAEMRRRVYQLRKLEMFYHLGPAVDKPSVCVEQ
jgi:hypothetical protein